MSSNPQARSPAITAKVGDCLGAWRRREAESLRPVVERYLPLVYSSALRRTGDVAQAVEVTRAVFLVLARRARKLSKKTVLAGWLFQITALACRKLKRKRAEKSRWPLRWFSRKRPEAPPDAEIWTLAAPEIDSALDRLAPRKRNAVLLCAFLNQDTASAAQILRRRERRVARHLTSGLKNVSRRLRRRGVAADPEMLCAACAAEGCAASIAEELPGEVMRSVEESRGRRPQFKLARRTLSSMAWARWRRRVAIGVPSFIALFAALAATAWHIDARSGHSRFLSAFLVWSVRNDGRTVPGLAQPARPWPGEMADTASRQNAQPDATAVRGVEDLYQTTNIWLVHLRFSREEWQALEPKRIGALPHFMQPDGTVLLRNPRAQRSGLAGVLGFDFKWSRGDLDFSGLAFTNAAVRFKGNGTFLGSLYGPKRAFKVDLNEHVKGQKLAGLDELTFNNLVVDHSFMSDALAYEFFRDAGVPSPRTAYAWMTVSVTGKWDRKPLGLYLMVEGVNEEFVAERFGSKKTPLFKPVTYELFEDIGDDWAAYEAVYDLKTKATPAQLQRVIDFARLVSHADDAEFAARLAEFLDLDEFARFLAAEVLLSSYDGILSTGQNFYVYLDPRSNRFGFIRWDLDLAWGGFFLLGSRRERERASIWHPWVGENRFLERVLNVEAFRRLYRAHLEDFSARLFVPEKLSARIDQIAAIIREPVAAESDFRLHKFDQAVGIKALEPSRGNPMGPDRQAHQLKRFIEKRAISVREQLEGKSEGMVLQRGGRK